MKEEDSLGQSQRILYSLSPSRLVIIIFALVFIIEVLIMFSLFSFPDIPHWLTAIIDATVLTVLLFPAMYFLVFRPIVLHMAEREKAEESLRESEKFLWQITDGLPVLIAYVDPQQRYRFVNKEYEHWFQIPCAQIIGKSVRELVGEAYYESIKKHINDVLSGKFVDYEDTLFLKDGKPRSIEAKYIPDIEKDGNVKGYFLMGQDITERRWAEEKILQLTHHKDLILESVAEGIFGLDREGKMTFVNSTAAQLLGYEVSELIGEKHHDKLHHSRKDGTPFPQIECPINAAYRDGIGHNGVEIFWRKDGTSMPVEYRSNPIIEKGELKGAVVTFFDISDLQRVAKEIEDKYSQLESLSHQNQLILESAGEGIFGLNMEGKIIFINPAAAENLGYEVSELIGEIHHKKVHHTKSTGEHYPEEECPIYAAYRDGTIHRGTDEVFWRKDGTSVPIEYVSSPIIEKGEIKGAVVTFSDLTERKRAEEALRESEERAKAQYKGVPIPTYTWQKKDNDFVLIDYNHAAEEITQGKVADYLGVSMNEMYKDRPEIREDMWRCYNERTIIKAEVFYKFKSIDKEGIFATHYSYVPPNLVLAHTEDITERKKAEKQLNESLREKEVLLREIHHRVKNNLQIVSSLLKLQSSHVDEGKVKDVFRDSRNRLRTMALIHEKLYQSRDLSRVDFAGYLRSLSHEIYTAYGISQSHIALQLSIEEIFLGVDIAIPCGLIVSELLSNCIKYAFPKNQEGKINITLRMLDGNEIELIVSDNGVGIPEHIDFRSSNTLGLQLVTILAEDQLNGNIVLDRSHGTSFHITFKIMGKK
jgi:PAS domain S-box-containing protein